MDVRLVRVGLQRIPQEYNYVRKSGFVFTKTVNAFGETLGLYSATFFYCATLSFPSGFKKITSCGKRVRAAISAMAMARLVSMPK